MNPPLGPRLRLLAALLVAAAAAAAVVPAAARPCPHTAVFTHALTRGADVCLCEQGLACAGGACLSAVPVRRSLAPTGEPGGGTAPAFTRVREGFPVSCTECTCVPPAGDEGMLQEPAKPTLYTTKDGARAADYSDPIFDAACETANSSMDGIPAPIALHNASWLHFPK
jgi:hypothetical protein